MKFRNLYLIGTIVVAAFLSQVRSSVASDEQGLIIHAAEIGIGKFHRYDNQVHPYEHSNIWLNYVLPDGASTKTPLIRDNDDQSVTIFFSNLEELLTSVQSVSESKHMKVDVLNLNAHGMPGAMWFPADRNVMNSAECKSWVESANGADKANYDQYYSPVSKSEIIQLRLLAKLPSMKFMAPCTTGASQWASVLKKHPQVKSVFASDAQVHLFSCVVGLGRSGKRFVTSLASTLLSGEGAKLQAAMNFGLGDWSMPEGMGFWDYLTDEQLDRDNEHYPVDRKDRDMMQKGQIRLAMKSKEDWQVGIVSNLDYMLGTKDNLNLSAKAMFEIPEEKMSEQEFEALKAKGLRVRVIGTNQSVDIQLK